MAETFTYQVVRVDNEAGVMDVIYSAEGKESLTVGVPIPRVGEDMALHMASYAPVGQWRPADTTLADIQVGMAGEIAKAAVPEAPASTVPVTEPPAPNPDVFTTVPLTEIIGGAA